MIIPSSYFYSMLLDFRNSSSTTKQCYLISWVLSHHGGRFSFSPAMKRLFRILPVRVHCRKVVRQEVETMVAQLDWQRRKCVCCVCSCAGSRHVTGEARLPARELDRKPDVASLL